MSRRERIPSRTIEMLVRALSNLLGRPIVDQTGLPGRFDFRMEWTPDAGPARPGPSGEAPEPSEAPDPPGRPSVFTAVQEQLGLKLVVQKGPVEIIVVERAERASPN